MDAIELLKGRRSIRSFENLPIDDITLKKILEITRWCFSAVNRQPWRFYVIRNKELIQEVAKECITGSFAAKAPVLVVIVGDPEEHPKWYLHDLSFVSLQLALAAWTFGIGTCWIGNINKDAVKQLLGLRKKDYILTVLPLGYPKGGVPSPRPRKELEELVVYFD
ncbi:MAG: nitroreductase family protein [Promethearchaeota archaeon]